MSNDKVLLLKARRVAGTLRVLLGQRPLILEWEGPPGEPQSPTVFPRDMGKISVLFEGNKEMGSILPTWQIHASAIENSKEATQEIFLIQNF